MSESNASSSGDDRPQLSYADLHTALPPADGQPFLQIIEQPQSRGFRFRYECEGKSHGGLQGENSRRERKSYPTVRVCNYCGPARITVSLVTDEKEPKPHAHELIGKNCGNGTCTVNIKGDNMTVSFPNLGIRHVTKKSVTRIVAERLRESLRADKMMDGELGQDADHISLSQMEETEIQRLAESQAKNMPLSVVRLSFRAYLLDSTGMCVRVLPPAISNPIYDSKAPCAALLKICRMDKVGGCCVGNEEIFLLCDKVQKDDVEIRFYEQDDEGNVKWEDYGKFAAHDVHRQYAVVFRTPAYVNTNIDRPVTVHVQLRRFSDSEVSDPKVFTYYPQQTDPGDIKKKLDKEIPNFSDIDAFNVTSGADPGVFKKKRKKPIPNNSDNDAFNVTSGAGMLNVAGILHTGLSSFTDIHQSVGHLDHKLPVSCSNVSRLEADSVSCQQFGVNDLVSRGVEQEPALTADKPKQEPKDEQQLTATESELVELLRCLSVRAAESVRRYAQSADARHLLLPARHLIACANEDGDNALHLSVVHGCEAAAANIASVLSTLPHPTAINDLNDLLQSPLQLAVLTRQSNVVKLLLAHGAQPQQPFDQRTGDTLLHVCARNGDAACLSALLQYWNKDSSTDTDHAWLPHIDQTNYHGMSAVHVSVCGGDSELQCVKLLVAAGANLNAVDGCAGRSALHYAVHSANLAVVGYLLLECGVDVDLPDNCGNTALHYAVAANNLGVAALLVAAGADADIENIEFDSDSDTDDEPLQSGKTARQLAVGNPKMLRVLNGECYSSVCSLSSDIAGLSVADSSAAGTVLKSYCDSGIESIDRELAVSDVSQLDAVVRMKLCKLLDPVLIGSDWQQLATLLGFAEMCHVFKLHKNPTLALLNNFELSCGSLAELRSSLLQMKRDDAVRLIDASLEPAAAQL